MRFRPRVELSRVNWVLFTAPDYQVNKINLQTRDKMLAEADQVGRARLLAAGCRESGVWLGAVPVSSLGTQLDPEVIRIGIALRLGAKV